MAGVARKESLLRGARALGERRLLARLVHLEAEFFALQPKLALLQAEHALLQRAFLRLLLRDRDLRERRAQSTTTPDRREQHRGGAHERLVPSRVVLAGAAQQARNRRARWRRGRRFERGVEQSHRVISWFALSDKVASHACRR
ncbi:MAG: hypothetical protein KJ011_05260 [Burkholderiaceae bacterium]|nr:hypothetical protein [Burkholderiaceae bacterium]